MKLLLSITGSFTKPENQNLRVVCRQFTYEMSKNLIRSKPSSCSLDGPIKLAFHKGCKMKVLNGHIEKQFHGRNIFFA
jgi:hypothetical protein